jgi:glycosyltransferase involved in cell wall biosynthesis
MHGVEKASGALIAFLDADDRWRPQKIALQIEAFKEDPTCQCVIGKARYFMDQNQLPSQNLKKELFEEDRISYLPGVFMATKKILQQIPFDPYYRAGSDTDWFFKLQEANIQVKVLPDVLLDVRMHANNLSHQPVCYKDLLHLLKASAKRKEQKGSLVSVIIPVYNWEKYLEEAIQSVLNQTYRPLDVIIVDDGSTDQSSEIALKFKDKIRYVFQSQGGIGKARNRGIEAALGTYIAFLDADDLWEPTKLAEQMALFTKEPNIQMVFAQMIHFFSPELGAETRAKYHFPENIAPGWIAGTLLMKKEHFLQVGLFDPCLRVGEFIEWFLRAKKQGLSMKMVDQVFLHRRIHGENTTLKQKKNLTDYLQILRKQIV